MVYAEALTLDQLRVVVTILDTGSFSAAARYLHRSQGAISYQVAAIESALELQLFDRSSRRPIPTEQGLAIAKEARAVLTGVDQLRGLARSMRAGREATLAIAVDVLFPTDRLTASLTTFRSRYPDLPLEVLGGVRFAIGNDVATGAADLGVAGAPAVVAEDVIVGRKLLDVTLVPVVAKDHPLARLAGAPIAGDELARHVHVVLRERGADDAMNIVSPANPASVWRMSDTQTRLAVVQAGLGWSRVPLHSVRRQLASGELVELDVTPLPSRVQVPLHAIYRRRAPPGPAGRWLVDHLADMEPPT